MRRIVFCILVVLLTSGAITSQVKDTSSVSETVEKAGFFRVLGEVTLSPIAGTICTVPFALGLLWTDGLVEDWQHANKNFHGNGPYQRQIDVLTAAGCLAYATGNAISIYLLSKGINDRISFWPVLGFSSLGFATGAYLGLHLRSIAPVLVLTTLLPVIYVNAISPESTVNKSMDKFYNEQFPFQSKSYKDIYNSSMDFKVHVLRVNL